MAELTPRQMIEFRQLVVEPLLKGVEEKMNASNADQLADLRRFAAEHAATQADVKALQQEVAGLKAVKIRMYWIASMVGAIVGVVWGTAFAFVKDWIVRKFRGGH